MSEIGKLISAAPDDLSYLSGHIQTLDGRLPISLEGDPQCRDQDRPSHKITTPTRDRSTIQIGSAWLKTAKHGPNAGKSFFSIQIDHPERPAPLNVAAFPNAAGEWVIVWRRRPAGAPSAT